MRTGFLIIISAFVLTACSGLAKVTAHFSVYNRSSDPIKVVIQGTERSEVIAPQSGADFDLRIEVPTDPSGVTSPTDRSVSIPVAIHNLTTGMLSRVEYCSAGARSSTTVVYDVEGAPPYTYTSVSCVTTY